MYKFYAKHNFFVVLLILSGYVIFLFNISFKWKWELFLVFWVMIWFFVVVAMAANYITKTLEKENTHSITMYTETYLTGIEIFFKSGEDAEKFRESVKGNPNITIGSIVGLKK